MSSIESFFAKCIPQSQSLTAISPAKRTVTVSSNQKFTLEQVLQNELKPPLSLQDFLVYLEKEDCAETLEFIEEVKKYSRLSSSLLNDNKKPVAKDTIQEEDDEVSPVSPTLARKLNAETLLNAINSIMNKYIVDNAPKDIFLPPAIRIAIAQQLALENYSADIFHGALLHATNLLNQNAFPKFLRQNQRFDTSSTSTKPEYTIHQIIEDSISPPFSFNDYHAFLRKNHCEENADFLKDVLIYQKLAFSYFPTPMPVSKVSNRGVSVILSRPPNLYSGRSATVEADRTAQHPSLYQLSSTADQAIVEHVMPTDGTNIPPCVKPESMTQEDFDKEISSLKKMCDEILNTYILEGSTREVNLPTLIRNPLISLLKDGTFHPDVFNIAYEHIANMLRVNRLSNFLQEGFDIARSASLIENSLPKFGLDQILRDETLPPYTKLDYYEYLKEHQMQQDLKFIIDLEEYTNSAEQFYPSKIFNPRGSAISHAKTKRMSANMSIVPDTAINRLNRDSSTKRRSTTSSNQYEFTSEQLATLTYIPGPERPSGMTVDVYQQNIDSLKEKALKLYDSYISMESTFSINIPPIIRKPLIEIIQDSHFHPQVFLAAKLAVLDHLTANTLPKFLKKSHQMILSSGLSFQLFSSNRRKIDQLLLEELPHPYSYSNFLEFAEPYNLGGEVDFLKAIVCYYKVATQLYPVVNPATKRQSQANRSSLPPQKSRPESEEEKKSFLSSISSRSSVSSPRGAENLSDVPKKPPHMSDSDYEVLLNKVQTMFGDIINAYFKSSQLTSGFLIPWPLGKPIIEKFEKKQYHPDAFTQIYDCYISKVLEIWDTYEKKINEVLKHPEINDPDYPKYNIKQLVTNELLPPYSYNDYMQYLKKELCDECLEFLRAVLDYQKEAASYYPPIPKQKSKVKSTGSEDKITLHHLSSLNDPDIPKVTMPASMNSETFATKKAQLQTMMKNLVDEYIRPESIKEVNLPVQCRKPFLKLYDMGFHHPYLLTELYDHISNMLRLNNLAKFLKIAYEQSPKVRAADRPVSRTASMMQKSNIKQVVMDELPAPYSVADFMKYLKTEHAEESLEFLLAVITYHKLASPYYPNPLPLAAKDTVTSATAGTPSITTPLETPSSVVPPVLAEPPEYITPPVPSPDVAKRIQDMFTVIVEDFITPGGQREINIIERHRKFILTEFKNGNYHPEIWKSTFEHIANLLRANSLIKFLKLSGVSISGQHSSYVSPTNTSLESTSPTKNSPATGRSISMKKK